MINPELVGGQQVVQEVYLSFIRCSFEVYLRFSQGLFEIYLRFIIEEKISASCLRRVSYCLNT